MGPHTQVVRAALSSEVLPWARYPMRASAPPLEAERFDQ